MEMQRRNWKEYDEKLVRSRDFVDLLAEMPWVREALSFKQIPHFTTVQRAYIGFPQA